MHQQRLLLVRRRGQLLVRREQRLLRLRRGVALHVRLQQRALRVPAIGQQVHDNGPLLPRRRRRPAAVRLHVGVLLRLGLRVRVRPQQWRMRDDALSRRSFRRRRRQRWWLTRLDHVSSIFFPIFFCIALFSFMACYGNRRRRARGALRAMDQQPGVNLLTGPAAVAMPIGGAAAPVAMPTAAPVAVPVGAGRRPSPCRSTLARRRRSPSPSAPCPSPLRPTSTARLSSCRASRWPPTVARRRRAFTAARRSDTELSVHLLRVLGLYVFTYSKAD